MVEVGYCVRWMLEGCDDELDIDYMREVFDEIGK